ncbi:MAG TPA: hypothetical protein VIV58_36305, partial [Kofleriaceae bacterium]
LVESHIVTTPADLLFGLGTGGETARAEPSKGNNVHPNSGSDDAPAPTPSKTRPPKVNTAGTGSGSAATPVAATGSGAGSAAKPAAGSGGGAAAAPAVTVAKLTIEVLPPAAAAVAKITVDGKELAPGASTLPAGGGSATVAPASIDLPAETKSVKVAVTAAGYHSIDKKVDVTAGAETKVQLELVKRGSSGGSPGFGGSSNVPNRVPTAPPKPKKPANSGIIDI